MTVECAMDILEKALHYLVQLKKLPKTTPAHSRDMTSLQSIDNDAIAGINKHYLKNNYNMDINERLHLNTSDTISNSATNKLTTLSDVSEG
jgi:hypothetical protein